MSNSSWHIPQTKAKPQKRTGEIEIIIRPNQNLWQVAQMYFGSFEIALLLAAYNDIEDPFNPPDIIKVPQ